MAVSFDIEELTHLRELARNYPTAAAAVAEAAILRASLRLPKKTVHVVSDVHGEYKKLRHVINNASGSLRQLVAELFADRLSEQGQKDLLAVLYYPHEAIEHLRSSLADPKTRRDWVRRTLGFQFEIIRKLSSNRRRQKVGELIPIEAREIFAELISEPTAFRSSEYIDQIVDALAFYERDLITVRVASRLARNLAVEELIVAGDLGDRGARLDKVIDYLMRQPKVAFTWGNHDVTWMGACLGQEALIATVLRISLRHLRLFQLQEGYGITLSPLEKLARQVYKNDQATQFGAKRTGVHDDWLIARMHKAVAVMQFKLEGQTILRHPEWAMQTRALLDRIDFASGTIEIDNEIYELRDTNFPTVDPANPFELSAAEADCMARLRESFVSSQRLWQQMSYVVRNGAMWLQRDDALIFHACVPIDESGNFLEVEVGGSPCAGRELFDRLDSIVRRSFRRGAELVKSNDVDWFWYLWTSALSPLFGKDRMTTFEQYFISDKRAHKERKNPYFDLIHDADFCRKITREFGLDDKGLIVNGHVPVKVERGEQPVKRSGLAVTIDGAFSESYGDRGYTLILAPERIQIAELHNFNSVADAIETGADIVPKIKIVREYAETRRVADTEDGAVINHRIHALERLMLAYQEGALLENTPAVPLA